MLSKNHELRKTFLTIYLGTKDVLQVSCKSESIISFVVRLILILVSYIIIYLSMYVCEKSHRDVQRCSVICVLYICFQNLKIYTIIQCCLLHTGKFNMSYWNTVYIYTEFRRGILKRPVYFLDIIYVMLY